MTNGSQGVSHGTTGFYDFDAAALSPNGFKVSLDFSRFVNPPAGTGGGGYIAFGFGVDSGAAINDFSAIGLSDFAVLFQQANNGNAANASAFEDNSGIGNFDYLTPDAPHSLVITATPAVAGSYGTGDTVNINVLVDGSISQNYSVSGGANFGSFAVSANNFDTRYIDDLVVESVAVPEPSMAGLTLIGLALGALRRRRK